MFSARLCCRSAAAGCRPLPSGSPLLLSVPPSSLYPLVSATSGARGFRLKLLHLISDAAAMALSRCWLALGASKHVCNLINKLLLTRPSGSNVFLSSCAGNRDYANVLCIAEVRAVAVRNPVQHWHARHVYLGQRSHSEYVVYWTQRLARQGSLKP